MSISILVNFLLLFEMVITVASASVDCFHHWPANGTWTDHRPFWSVHGCDTKIFNTTEIKACLNGKSVYVMGNSVARQSAYGIYEMLGGDEISRSDQKIECPKDGITWGSSCSKNINNVTIKYLYKNTFDGYDYSNRGGIFPFLHRDKVRIIDGMLIWAEGFQPKPERGVAPRLDDVTRGDINYAGCGARVADGCALESTAICLENFFHGSQTDDVLIFTLGFTYPLMHPNKETQSNSPIDFRAWIMHTAPSFKSIIDRAFRGQVVWVSLAPANPDNVWGAWNPDLRRTSELLWHLWRPHVSLSRPWIVIDQWAINEGREHLYRDEIHFPGNLTTAMLYQVLTAIC